MVSPESKLESGQGEIAGSIDRTGCDLGSEFKVGDDECAIAALGLADV